MYARLNAEGDSMRKLLIVASLLLGCDEFGFKPTTPMAEGDSGSDVIVDTAVDEDGDGYTVADGDCDDTDGNTSPSAIDLFGDDIDQNCDGVDGIDGDGDGFASVSSGGDDCNDTDALIHPNALETWYDGVDQNCDEWSDFDQDRDYFDSDNHGGQDCNDSNAQVNPNASENWYDGIDQDCRGDDDYDQD